MHRNKLNKYQIKYGPEHIAAYQYFQWIGSGKFMFSSYLLVMCTKPSQCHEQAKLVYYCVPYRVLVWWPGLSRTLYSTSTHSAFCSTHIVDRYPCPEPVQCHGPVTYVNLKYIWNVLTFIALIILQGSVYNCYTFFLNAPNGSHDTGISWINFLLNVFKCFIPNVHIYSIDLSIKKFGNSIY